MRIGITKEDVFRAATQLKQLGEKITIEKIRNHLGNKGSNSTISSHLKEYRKTPEFNFSNAENNGKFQREKCFQVYPFLKKLNKDDLNTLLSEIYRCLYRHNNRFLNAIEALLDE